MNSFFRKNKYTSDIKDFNYINNLLKQKKVDKEFINKVKLLTIEDLLYIKLQTMSNSLRGKLLGIPVYKFLDEICKEAFVRYAISVCKNRRDACVMLGINKSYLNRQMKKYKINIKEENNENKKS